MGHLKTLTIGSERFGINVSKAGEFYANVPDYLQDAFRQSFSTRAEDCIRVEAKTLQELESTLRTAVQAYNEPEVLTEAVIQYNVGSHVSFWCGDDGEIYPNGYAASDAKAGGQWADSERFGQHHAANPSAGGYSLIIGAKALLKTTKIYRGGRTKIAYDPYYGEDGDHLGCRTPAERLNAWCSFNLPENPSEMPYSDQAALFFYDLMLGMAKLSKLVMDHAGDKKSIQSLIDSGARLLESPRPTATPSEQQQL